MKILCGLKQKMDNESLGGCFSSPKKNKYITRIFQELNDIEEDNVYLILENYHTSTGFQLYKGDCVLKCFEHTFGLVGVNETSVTIPILKENGIIYNTFIVVPSFILGVIN
jgi:hypothetical protein